jgi:DNA-directed RNA polymerase beta subunit
VHNTPEGASVGIVKNLSYMTHITIHSNSLSLHEYIEPYIININNADIKPSDMFNKIKVLVNGCWMGYSNNPVELYDMLKEKKHSGIINIYTSIVFDYKMKEIRICNDAGRLTRPLLRVKNNDILLNRSIVDKLRSKEVNWDNLFTNTVLENAILEYIDPEEQSYSLVSVNYNELINSKNNPDKILHFTHCEIHPSTIFGILASCIPFPEHNQSPRNTYQCLDINELVLMSDGTHKKIKDVNIGDMVVTFHPETLDRSISRVINQYVRETDKKLYKIKTISGREIIATDDHKFMTEEGWKTVDNFNVMKTKIGILINQNQQPFYNLDKVDMILSIEKFVEIMENNKIHMKMINKHVKELTEIGLLPLYNNNCALPIIARIFGYILADGSINIYERTRLKNENEKYDTKKYISCGIDFGCEKDVIDFENDLKQIGFNTCNYRCGSRTFNGVTHTTWSVIHNGCLPALLISLGISFGRKTENERKPVPSWIFNGELLIKREFLSGFQGGDGCGIRWNKLKNSYNFICAETSQQILPKFKESLYIFMNQCKFMMNEFDIEIININESIVSEDRIKIGYKISDKQENLIKYFENIGYRYCLKKQENSGIIVEYLRVKKYNLEKRKIDVNFIRRKYDEGLSISQIARENNKNYSYISDCIKSYKNNRNIISSRIKENNISEWIENISTRNGCMFIPIDSIVEIENRLVSDITVESENHSFIAGDNFLSSNCAQGKQAMGVYVTNYENRMDKTAYVLNYPTRPLVDTRVMNMIHLNKIPSGTNVIVAIMTHTGYNQEDSLLFNKGSIDRGLFIATIYHTEKDEDKQRINGDEEIRCRPDPAKTKGMKFGNYNKVNNKGVIPENSLVENRDIIIAKITPIKENRNDHTKVIKYEDQSKIYRTNEETYIDKNYIDRNGDGYNFAKVKLRIVRKPVIGDKFSSRHGQKGTIGNIIPEEDIPFTKDGLKPDIIINPHAIPSRMTIGQLKETVLGKILLSLGLFGDGTSFGDFEVKDICKELLKVGYEARGNELLYNGLTGEQIECSVFMGPVFYQRLKHMVNDKTHSRSIGPMVNLTRQPAEGRSRDGGLRFGEMERDCMVSHGASRFTQDRMYYSSDKYEVYVCKQCGLISAYNDNVSSSIHHCKTCDNRTNFGLVKIPYACKLIFHELQSMNVVPRIITEHL